jgi:hypoxanthine phosphoribosyltransferase
MKKKRPRSIAPKPRGPSTNTGLETRKLRVVFTTRQIQNRVRQLARAINRDYKGKTLHVVGVLENGFVFMADLVRLLQVPVICQFVKAQIQERATNYGISVREITYTPRIEATGKNILLVDGILQSGVTQDHLLRYFLGQMPASFRMAALVEKEDELKVDLATDYVGFRTQGKYLVGYGLGYQDQYRNLPHIAQIS